jgi:hypothetical protein
MAIFNRRTAESAVLESWQGKPWKIVAGIGDLPLALVLPKMSSPDKL